MLRILLAAIALTACTAPGRVAAAGVGLRARTGQAGEEKAEKKKPPAKAAQKDQQERTAFTPEELDAAVIPGIADARAWGDAEKLRAAAAAGERPVAGDLGRRIGRRLRRRRAHRLDPIGQAAGIRRGHRGEHRRAHRARTPSSDRRYDEAVRKNFTTISAADIFEDRMSRDSLFDYWPLKRQIEQNVTGKLLAEIAAQHARGRRLLIATTSLDAGRRVVWNMGAIAARGDERAIELFRAILLASCSIPGFFAPVAIDVEANGKKIPGNAQRRHA